MPAHKKGEKGYHKNRYEKKIRFAFSLDTVDKMMDNIRTKPRVRGEKPWLGIDPLRDKSLLGILWWSGLRISEIVGDRERSYMVSRFTKDEQLALKLQDINWRDLENPLIKKTSPIRPGICKEDMEIQDNILLVVADPLKHGEREAPLELPLNLPYVDLIVEQWDRTQSKQKVWDLRKEYAWAIMKELGTYPHHFRFTRATALVRNFKVSPLHLKNWMGWKRLETAYAYLETGGRYQRETGELLLEQYGEKNEDK